MFEASDKFNVEIKNVGTEDIIVLPLIDKSDPLCRVQATPRGERLEPGQSMMLIGYEPGIWHRISPADRIGPVGMLSPVRTEFGKPGIIERATRDLASFGQAPEDFLVDLRERKVVHRHTGIWFTFYEHANQALWDADNSVAFHDKPEFHGDRRQLAENAKRAAVKAGMGYRREQ